MTVPDNGDAGGPPPRGASPDPDFTALISQLRVDELMTEVQERFTRISDSRRQLAGLMESMLAISSGLDLQDTLRAVVRSAMGLVGARYGAVGVRGDDGLLAAFVHEGLDDETRNGIGPLRGARSLGALIDRPEVMRLPDNRESPCLVRISD